MAHQRLSLTSLCFAAALSLAPAAQAQEDGSFHLMTFNVENLFDTKHDEGKEDYTYLPREAKQDPEIQNKCRKIQNDGWRDECLNLDWNDTIVNNKMATIAQVILADNNGQGPDVVVMPEVENVEVLEKLRKDYLEQAGYKHAVLLEGDDERGIDVGVITKLPLRNAPELHRIPFKSNDGDTKTRGILQVDLVLPNNKTARVYGVHFPSPSNPSHMRKEALQYLNKIASDRATEVDVVVAAGDFNITIEEQNVYKNVEDSWDISHKVGCQSCEGTSYYAKGNTWSFLDVVMVLKKNYEDSPAHNHGFETESIHIANGLDIQKTNDGKPHRFNVFDGSGVSDHFPMAAKIRAGE